MQPSNIELLLSPLIALVKEKSTSAFWREWAALSAYNKLVLPLFYFLVVYSFWVIVNA